MIRVQLDTETIESAAGSSLFECAERAGVRVPTSCFKNGRCRECLVEVIEGSDLLSPPSPEEVHLRDGFRLACRARLEERAGVVRCRTLRRGEMRILAAGAAGASRPLSPAPAVVRHGTRLRRDGLDLGPAPAALHGLALDVGTTTVVLRLVDLESGDVVAVRSLENPQRFGGSDVMARISYDGQNPGKLLQRTLLAYVAHAIDDLPCAAESIVDVVVAGNSTMRDLFFGLPVDSIGQRPYRSLTENALRSGERETTRLVESARKLRLPVHRAALVRSLPVVSGHVGADAAACLLALDLLGEERTVAVMDLGTNTELFVGDRHRLFAASCPAGPAFEGGLVSSAMPALEGAIERIRLTEGEVSYDVIGGGEPQGICGSGLVDLLGELCRTARMNELGRLVDESPRFVVDARFDLALSEADISHLAQAKGANVAGLRVVLEASGIDLDDISVFYLAGGFAHHLDLAAARRIGLVPDLPDERIRVVGNAALEGATRALLSTVELDELDRFVRTVEHVELETHASFFDHFVEGCQFVPVRSVRT